MRKLLVLAGVTCLVALFGLAYELVFGKLFPFTPVVLGFTCQERSHVVVCSEDDNPFGGFEWTDDLVGGVEKSHELTFKTKPRLFFFGKDETYARRSISKARVCAFYNGAVMVSPWIQREDAEGLLSLRVYLTHELSHSLLYQNMGLVRKLGYPRWLMEGVATYSSNQMGTYLYPSQEGTHALIRNGNWIPPEDYETEREDEVPLSVENRKPFMYTEFACIVSDLNSQYSRSAFLGYLKLLLTEPDHDAAFQASFGVGFDEYLAGFRERVVQMTRP
jgi:hypothetical protein